MALVSNVLGELSMKSDGAGKKRALIVQFVFDASYPAKGYTIAASTLGLTTIDAIVSGGVTITDTADSGLLLSYDKAAGKLVLSEAGADGAGLDDATATSVTTGSNAYALVLGW